MDIKVTLPYDPHWRALDWAKKHCPSYITNQSSKTTKIPVAGIPYNRTTHIDYYFSNEKDAVYFSLKWS